MLPMNNKYVNESVKWFDIINIIQSAVALFW